MDMKSSMLFLCYLFVVHLPFAFSQETVTLSGSGSFSAILVQSLLLSYYSVEDGVTINYVDQPFSLASSQFLSYQTEFLIGTASVPAANRALSDCCNCDDIRALPIAVSGVALIHSIGGWGTSPVSSITISRQNLSDIYLGHIVNWQQLDPSYPSGTINVVHQTCSGPDIFTTGLAAFSTQWTACPGTNFPVGTAFATDREALAHIKTTPNSIGYVSYSTLMAAVATGTYSSQMVGLVNKAGNSVLPTLTSIGSAAADFESTTNTDTTGIQATLVDAPGQQSWPLAGYEYVTIRSKNNPCPKLDKLFLFFTWVLSAREERKEKLESYGIATPPDSVLAQCITLLNSFVCCTKVSTTTVIAKGTPFVHQAFANLGSTYFSGATQLSDEVLSSSTALTQLGQSSIDAALSTTYPTDTSFVPIRLFGAAVVCAANIAGFGSSDAIVLDRSTLAAIFDQRITSWGDTSIVSRNSQYQSNLAASGTITLQPFSDVDTQTIMSQAFASFDSTFTGAYMPEVADGTAAAVLSTVAGTVGSVGCFPLSSAITFPASTSIIGLRNAAGTTIARPTGQHIFAAMEDFAATKSAPLVNGPGNVSWPICAYDYLVLNRNGRCTQLSDFARFAVWVFTTLDAQGYIYQGGLSPPPAAVSLSEQQVLLSVSCGGSSVTPDVKYVYGAGASFPLLPYQSWPIYFATLPDPVTNDASAFVRVSYVPGGSELGQILAEQHLVHFGATDVSLGTGTEFGLTKFPTLAGALSLVFNLGPSIMSLVMSRTLIVQIYSGVVTQWDDSRIKDLNPSASLPSQPILLVYRRGASGSTYILKKALQSFSSTSAPWTGGVDMSASWPVSSNLTGADSYEVALVVQTHIYSFGYVESAYGFFTNLPACTIINKAGNHTNPEPTSIASAINDFPLTIESLVTDIVDGAGAGSYPLASYTFVLTNESWYDCPTGTRTLSYLQWSISDDTPRTRAQSFGFVPLPKATVFLVEELLRTLNCSDNTPALPAIAKGCDGVISSGIKRDACGDCGGANTSCCLGTSEQVSEYCFKCDYAPGYPHFLLNSYKCDGFLDCTDGEDDLECTVSIVKTSIVLSVFAAICIVVCVIVGVDVFMNRNERIFRESNVFFMMMILAGCIIGFTCVFVLSQLTKLNNFVCGVQYWFFGVAFVLTFGSMIAKTYQVYMLHRQHSGDLSAYTNQAIVRYVAAAMLVEIVILLIWTAFDRPRPVLKHNDPSEHSKLHYICGNQQFAIFAILLALYKGIILILGVILSFLSRGIDFEGNESRLIRKTILSAALLAAVIFPILISLGSSFPFVRILLSNIALLLLASLIMFTYFGPKLMQFHFGGDQFSESKGMRLLGPIDI